MQRKRLRESLVNSFWLSVLLHLLILLSFSTVLIWPSAPPKQPNMYVPAYTYTPPVSSSLMQPKTYKTTTSLSKPVQQEQKQVPTSKHGLQPKSLFAASQNFLRETQLNSLSASSSNSDPIYLIGDGHDAPDPIIKLLAKALSAHFSYPKVAGELGIKGKVYIGLTLHPEGYLTDIQLVRSSNSPDLDAAALYAVNTAPEIIGLRKFLPQPKHFVIGFVFH